MSIIFCLFLPGTLTGLESPILTPSPTVPRIALENLISKYNEDLWFFTCLLILSISSQLMGFGITFFRSINRAADFTLRSSPLSRTLVAPKQQKGRNMNRYIPSLFYNFSALYQLKVPPMK